MCKGVTDGRRNVRRTSDQARREGQRERGKKGERGEGLRVRKRSVKEERRRIRKTTHSRSLLDDLAEVKDALDLVLEAGLVLLVVSGSGGGLRAVSRRVRPGLAGAGRLL